MNAELTVSMDEALIEQAQQYAQEHNMSVSDLVSHFFTGLTNHNAELNAEPTALSENAKNILALAGSWVEDDDTFSSKAIAERRQASSRERLL